MSNKILRITATIGLSEDEFKRAALIAKCQPLMGIIFDWMKEQDVDGIVTLDFVTKRAPKAERTGLEQKQAAE